MLRQERVIVESVYPQLNGGDFFIKRVQDESIKVYADVLPDGHDVIQAEILFQHETEKKPQAIRMQHQGNDVYYETFKVTQQGFYTYQVRGWVDYALNWQHGIEVKIKDGQHVVSELQDGIQYLKYIKKKGNTNEKAYAKELIVYFEDEGNYDKAIEAAASTALRNLFLKYPQRILANSSKKFKVYVDRKKANFSTWYEFFPRSAAEEPDKHGTFKDCERLLPKIAEMGFDTLYFPPIHPIGEKNRKGKNNTVDAKEGDSGVPWAIGSRHGGHKSIHPELGTEEDFKHLIGKAMDLGIEVAMDIAYQAAPDHPYLTTNPEWFRKRPDGTIQYAENPPKKYQDIVNFYFENTEFKALWEELLSVVMHWADLGIKMFRVDNPHTKPYYFWNWLIGEVKKKHPDALFLAEAFSRPKVMQQLAKQGFSQSYTYFTWRVNKWELTEYLTELTQTDMKEYYRPNFWPNTPDINPYHLQGANEAMHLIRYALAATLSGNLGIYGPVFEYMVTEPYPNKEEYLDCEKYEIRHWDWSIENKITHVISKINIARKNHPALQQTNNLRFCHIENDNLMAFYKWNDDKTNEVVVVISLDSHHMQQGTVQLPMQELAFSHEEPLHLMDVITENEYDWYDEWNFVELTPSLPFHIFHIKR